MDTKVHIKICGLQTIQDIEIINDLAVDYVGFVFAPSQRKISPKKAKELKQRLRSDIKTVGIFVNEEISKVNQLAKNCLLDIVQLHGEEPPAYCSQIVRPVWKSLSIGSLEDVARHQDYSLVSGILLDTFIPGLAGGSGQTFDWDMASGLSREKLILAGGLSPSNVLQAIQKVRPHVVDVSSGVETKGIKDRVKIQAFIRSVKEYE